MPVQPVVRFFYFLLLEYFNYFFIRYDFVRCFCLECLDIICFSSNSLIISYILSGTIFFLPCSYRKRGNLVIFWRDFHTKKCTRVSSYIHLAKSNHTNNYEKQLFNTQNLKSVRAVREIIMWKITHVCMACHSHKIDNLFLTDSFDKFHEKIIIIIILLLAVKSVIRTKMGKHFTEFYFPWGRMEYFGTYQDYYLKDVVR